MEYHSFTTRFLSVDYVPLVSSSVTRRFFLFCFRILLSKYKPKSSIFKTVSQFCVEEQRSLRLTVLVSREGFLEEMRDAIWVYELLEGLFPAKVRSKCSHKLGCWRSPRWAFVVQGLGATL
ncbi:hypothetical protein V6N13_105890 [Hibiscus sabdariffa]